MSTVSLRELLGEATRMLAPVAERADIDAWRIIEQISGHDSAELRFELDRPVTVREIARFDGMVARRAMGEPLQYVLGSWAFRTLDLFLDHRVLIPRPETEVVAGHALDALDQAVRDRGGSATGVSRAVDLGTGSGAIALSIAVERPTTQVWATDHSTDALDVARANLSGLGVAARGVTMAAGDWFGALDESLRGTFDLVVSNPPYVAADEDLPAVVRQWEPTSALISGPSGLEAYERIVGDARRWLNGHGALVLEIGASQGESVLALARRAGFTSVAVHQDLAGRDRVVVAR